MHYSFDAYPLAYVAAALVIFGLPMTCIFLAALRSYSQNALQLRSGSRPSVTSTTPIVKSVPATPSTAAAKPATPKAPKVIRRRALEVKLSWVSLPITPGSNNP